MARIFPMDIREQFKIGSEHGELEEVLDK